MTALPVSSLQTVEDLVAEHNRVDDFIKGINKQFAERLASYKARLEEINNQLLALSNSQKWESMRTDAGTCYRSTLLNTSIENRDALLDFCLKNWEAIGGEMLLVSAQKDAVRRWMDEHGGQPPPGVKTGWFTRMNVRRS